MLLSQARHAHGLYSAVETGIRFSSQVSVEKRAPGQASAVRASGPTALLRMPPRILSMPTLMRRFLVASCLAEVTQQIHSFRASGVISAQRLLAVALDSMRPPEVCW